MQLNFTLPLLIIIGFSLVRVEGVIAQDSALNLRNQIFSSWEIEELLPGGRFDAIVNLQDGVFLVGSRGKDNPGKIFRSHNYGQSWVEIRNEIEDEITCLAAGSGGQVFLLTGTSLFYLSVDYGLTWSFQGKVSQNSRFGNFKLSYGIAVTKSGTILISDTDPDGGHVFRSVDQGKTWSDIGMISDHSLYRFESTNGAILVNGWQGIVYKSVDDGLSWRPLQQIEHGPLYATEHLEGGLVFQASESGQIYRSENDGDGWLNVGRVREAADDFVSLGKAMLLLSTYTKSKNLYVSTDAGGTWRSVGKVNPSLSEDWLDHVISYENDGASWLLGCTNKGYVVRARVSEQSVTD